MTKMTTIPENYNNIRAGIVELLKTARSAAARNVNSIMTATYWEIGRRIVKSEQGGEHRAEYGEQLIKQLAEDLSRPIWPRIWAMRISGKCGAFYLAWPHDRIFQTLSEESSTPMILNDIRDNSSTIPALANQLPVALVRLRATAFRQEPGSSNFL